MNAAAHPSAANATSAPPKKEGTVLCYTITMSGIRRNLTDIDPWLEPYTDELAARRDFISRQSERILDGKSVADFALGHLYYGLHRNKNGWVFREWAPNAMGIYFVLDAPKQQEQSQKLLHKLYSSVDSFVSFADGQIMFRLGKLYGSDGDWQLELPVELLHHQDKYHLHIKWNGGEGDRLPSYATYVVQDKGDNHFDAVVWAPEIEFAWQNTAPSRPETQLIYEAHVGMSGDREAVSTYAQFEAEVLPRVQKLGYNTVQLMAIQEHPYYGSFGYQVSNFFAPSSRFGTPDELKHLIDTAHGMGLRVVMDLIHSHSVKNEAEGLSNFAGDKYQYFRKDDHPAWDSRLFDYGKPQVSHFLLSNIRYWLDEYHLDGFRFDGVTSMIYHNHGLEQAFTSYDDYFGDNVDNDALAYLSMANELTHQVNPGAITIAEDMSGMPGLAASADVGGIGFDYRFNMGAPDLWIKMLKDQRDEDWSMGELFHQLTSHRPEERTINYCESHDQALVGDKTIAFRLMDKDMYDKMSKDSESLIIDRGIALHKMIRLITAATNAGGYLNFMGNEFGHPEWIDFPRKGNDWSYKYARRQWHLTDDENLRYHDLNEFDIAMINVIKTLHEPDYSFVNVDEKKKIISFVRDGLLFAFNFSSDSYADLSIEAPYKDYQIILSTDNAKYGGFGRIKTNMLYQGKADQRGSYVEVYLPARTAIVMKPKYLDLTNSPWSKVA